MSIRTKRMSSWRPHRLLDAEPLGGVSKESTFFNKLPGSFLQTMRFENFCPSLWINAQSFSPGFHHLCFAKLRSGFEKPWGRMPCCRHKNPWLGAVSFLCWQCIFWLLKIVEFHYFTTQLDHFQQEKAVTPGINGWTQAFELTCHGSVPFIAVKHRCLSINRLKTKCQQPGFCFSHENGLVVQ